MTGSFRLLPGILVIAMVTGCPGPGRDKAVCGNGVVEAVEICDDGNRTGGDGCSSDCQTESCVDGTACATDFDCPGGMCSLGLCTACP